MKRFVMAIVCFEDQLSGPMRHSLRFVIFEKLRLSPSLKPKLRLAVWIWKNLTTLD